MKNEKKFKSFTYIIKHEAVMKSGISISTYSKCCIVNVIANFVANKRIRFEVKCLQVAKFRNIQSDTSIRCNLPYSTEFEVENDFETYDEDKGKRWKPVLKT